MGDVLNPGYKLQNRYEIKQVLGAGAFGTVYLAHDLILARDVAIKELGHEHLADEVTRTRFINDARAMGQLEHPNVVTVYDLLEPETDPVNNYYIIMKYMMGGSLEHLLRNTEVLPIRDSLEIVKGVCMGLARAHDAGIVHRDIKPDNILLGAHGEVRLCDFGIAHIPGLRLTTGGQPGTLLWLSVEQAQNQPEIDGRSDLYSLNAVLYKMLTGKNYLDFEACISRVKKADPLLAEEDMRRRIFKEVCHTITNSYPERAKKHRPEIPEQLDVLILKGLSKKPEDRFQAASEMVEAFNEIAGMITVDIDDRELQRAAKLLDDDRIDEATQIVKKVLRKYDDNAAAHEIMGDIHQRYREYSPAINEWIKTLNLQPERFSLYSKLGSLYNRMNNFDKATEIFRKGLVIRPDDPYMNYGLAVALRGNGQHQTAVDALKASCDCLPDRRREALLTRWMQEMSDKGPG